MDNNMYMNNLVDQSGQVLPVQPAQQYQQQTAPVHQPQVAPINCDTVMNVTSLQDLQSYSAGVAVRFPDFAEGQPFVALVRRPSLLALAKSGQIPNSLLSSAGDLFTGSSNGKNANNSNENTLREMYEVCRIVCRACLRAPTMDDIERAGLELTDEQIMAIFNYTQVGVKALDSFRQE